MDEHAEGEAFEFEAEIWEVEQGSWAFVTLPGEVGDDLRLLAGPPRGFGSIRVEVSCGATTWRTSVFPDKRRGYLLPMKRAVRRAESLEIGDPARLRLRALD
ncbi:DUF1905 domain-containing protein [Nocardioides ferulae]|uniref:DUF1905 domain-containing protein n=1 Tax=Nocardioides ferulae TaxID=2340821 RepID=UPI000EAF0C0C|nr:DUF1905 domain-containing protein [Nocardioides ferulae]